MKHETAFTQHPIEAGFTLWFTGLPCSGKTTLSDAVEKELLRIGHRVEHLDGDVFRLEQGRGLGYSKEDRLANVERAVFTAALLSRNGVAAVVSFISPYRSMREAARRRIGNFIEVHVHCPIEVCEARDTKGMYRKARRGEIELFTGVSDPYEEPEKPEVRVDTSVTGIPDCVAAILGSLDDRGLLLPRNPFPGNERLTRVFEFAARQHYGQKRQGGLPYITHPIAVARLLQGAGYGEDVLAAALLHDVLEDTGCEVERLERIAGPRAAAIVCEVTDRDKTADWQTRKSDYRDRLASASAEAAAVSCADKIHNLEGLIEGVAGGKDSFAKGFSAGMAEKLENYRQVAAVLGRKTPPCGLLGRYLECLERLSGVLSGRS